MSVNAINQDELQREVPKREISERIITRGRDGR